MAFLLEAFAVHSFQPRIRRVEGLIDHVIDRIREAVVLKSHSLSQHTKEVDIRFAFAERFDRLIRNLQKIMTVGVLQVFMFEERGCG